MFDQSDTVICEKCKTEIKKLQAESILAKDLVSMPDLA